MMKGEEKEKMSVLISNLFCYNCSTLFSKIDNFKSHHCHNASESKSPTKKSSSSSRVKQQKKSITTSKTKEKKDDHKPKSKTTSVKMKNDVKPFYGRVQGVNGKSVVLKTKPILEELEDYMHCCRCYLTFYKLPDLVKHFKECQLKRSESFQEYKTTEKNDGDMNIKIMSVSSVPTTDSLENNIESNSNNNEINNNTEDELLTIIKQVEAEVAKSLATIVEAPPQDSLDFPDSPCTPSSPINNEDTNDIHVPSRSSSPSSPQDQEIQEEEKEEKEESEIKSQDDIKKNKSRKRKRKPRPSTRSYPTADPSNIEFPLLTCPTCFRIFKLPGDMKKHMLKHGEKNVKCHLCSFTCYFRTAFYLHMRKTHPDKDPYRCYKYPACPMTFPTHEEMKAHRTFHRIKRYYCSEPGCTVSYTSKTTLLYHLNTHKKIRPLICEKCGAGFETRNQLSVHYVVHRTPTYKCEFEGCEKMFKSVTLRKSHMLRHGTEKFKCTVPGCEAAYFAPKLLKYHVRIMHEREQETLCPVCGKCFLRETGLQVHLLSHNGEKTVPCTFEGCSMTFMTKANRKRHMKTHTGEKPYECRYPSCGKKFSNCDGRKRHEQTHSQAKPFVCAFCPEAFPDNRPLKKHVLDYHQEEEEFDINVPTSYRAPKTN